MSLPPSADRLNEYANSMFAHEALPQPWIENCARYLHLIFGDRLVGKTIIDYAFGRGNWSLAFKKLGAERIIAIDASQDNVSRFSAYCAQNRVEGVEVVQGNLLESSRWQKQADLVWVYGVLHHIEPVEVFLSLMGSCARDAQTQFLFYHYESSSPRQMMVEMGRRLVTYETRSSFEASASLFIRAARLRARDDLTAPYIAWRSENELVDLLRACGFSPLRSIVPFEEFQSGKRSNEFRPAIVLCDRSGDTRFKPSPQSARFLQETQILENLFEALEPAWSQERISFVSGFFNTYYGALGKIEDIDRCLAEVFVYWASLFRERPDLEKGLDPHTAQTLKSWRVSLLGEGFRAQNRIEAQFQLERFRI